MSDVTIQICRSGDRVRSGDMARSRHRLSRKIVVQRVHTPMIPAHSKESRIGASRVNLGQDLRRGRQSSPWIALWALRMITLPRTRIYKVQSHHGHHGCPGRRVVIMMGLGTSPHMTRDRCTSLPRYMSFTVPSPPRTQLYNRSCSNKHTQYCSNKHTHRGQHLTVHISTER